jgi:hypothetical protein
MGPPARASFSHQWPRYYNVRNRARAGAHWWAGGPADGTLRTLRAMADWRDGTKIRCITITHNNVLSLFLFLSFPLSLSHSPFFSLLLSLSLLCSFLPLIVAHLVVFCQGLY